MTNALHRRTKIVATIGPGSDNPDSLFRLIEAGVDVFRLNFSHGSAEHHAAVAERVRKQAAIAGRYVGILADLQGPKIRIAGFKDGKVELASGDRFVLDLNMDKDSGDARSVGVDFPELANSVKSGDTLLLDDGRVRLTVNHVVDQTIECSVVIGGILSSRKGINKLGGGLSAPALTEKDIADIRSLSGVNPDFVAVSFVSCAEDIALTQRLLDESGVDSRIIAKIERAEVVADSDTLDAIIDASFGVMVARGDLGVEVGDAQLIGIQKDLISRARRMDRVVITATQMMESMISNPMPTRAEVFDVANAVLDGTDAVMLSAETAVGRYPVEVVRAMADSALGAERHPVARSWKHKANQKFCSTQETIAVSAIYAASHNESMRGIACLTESGHTPLLMSRISSGLPIFALSDNHATLQRLALCRGVIPLYFDYRMFAPEVIEERAVEFLKDGKYVDSGDAMILTKGEIMGRAGSTNILKILNVG